MTTPPDPRDVPLLDSGPGKLRLELELSEGAGPEADPFLPLDDSGRLSRVLLGRIASGDDATIRPVAVKVQKSLYRKGATSLGQDTLSGRRVDDLWNREKEHLARCGGNHVIAPLDLGASGVRSRPITFCRKVNAYFHPLCPACRGYLEDCRDDGLLRDLGLPEYATSSTRYLYCPSCAGKGGGERTFYTFAPTPEESPRGKVRIRRRGELYRDFLALTGKASPEAERARLQRVFPCFDCAHRGECYPSGAAGDAPIPAESNLVPVSFYESHVLVMDPVEFHYDEVCDWLGGATWKEVRERAGQSGGAGRARLLSALDGPVEAAPAWLFGASSRALLPLEVLSLKLGLFAQVCRGVAAYHDRCGQPHLDLSPSKVMVHVAAPPPSLPARWSFDVRLVGVGGAPRLNAGSGTGAASELLVPPPNADKMYVAPMARQMSGGREEPMRITVAEVQPDSDGIRMRGRATSGRIRMDEFGPRDVVRIVPASGSGALENRTIWGVLEEKEDRGFAFAAQIPEAAGAATKPGEFEATVSIYKRYHVPCDLYGLGMLFFRALLVHDGRDVFGVDDAIQRVLQKLLLGSQSGSDQGRKIADRLPHLLDEEKDVFAASSVLFREADRSRGAARVPARLWADLLRFGFRLLTMTPGFSFCADHSDYPPDRPGEVMERVAADFAELDARARVELFGRAERDREIFEACSDLLAEAGTL